MNYIEEKDERFYIANSKEVAGGKGLFAKQNLNKDDYLEIIGVIPKNDHTRLCMDYAKSYAFATKHGECLIPTGFGAIVNHAGNPQNQNVHTTFIDDMVVYQCIKDINKDEEILGNYGEGFANVLALYLMLNGKYDIGVWADECEQFSIKNQKNWEKIKKYNINCLYFLN